LVTNDDRNNLLIIIVVITTVVIATFLINGFISKMQQITDHGEQTMNRIGTQLVGNISNATKVNTLNLFQFNKSMADVVTSNDKIVASNNVTIGKLTDVVHNFSAANIANGKALKDNIANNTKTFLALLKEQHDATVYLGHISKQLSSQFPLIENGTVSSAVIPTVYNNHTGNQTTHK
jgi:flagellar biosynthesis/type III secretory pathway chaperone